LTIRPLQPVVVKRTFSLLVFLATSLAILGCQKKESTLKIGLAGVQTGPDGQIGSTMIFGSQIAIEEWNAKGGLLGKKIEAISRDDEGKPNQAVAVAQEIVSQGAVAVIGHFNSGCTIPSSEIYQQNNLIQITPGSTNPQVTERGFQNLFRVVGRDDQQGIVAGTFAREKLKLKKIAILHNKTAYGQGLAEEVQKTFRALGGDVVLFSGLNGEEMDFRASISAIEDSGAEALFWGGMYGQAAPLIVQLRDSGSEIPFLSGDGTIVEGFLSTAGPKATKVYLTFGPDFKKIPSAQAFLTKYRSLHGQEGPYSVYGYDAANILFSAMEKAGSTDVAQVSAALRATRFDTCLGPVEFNEKGDLKQPNYIIWTVENGNYTVLP
jgi:branched-chain amino acid transport system substrate-binding protein